MGDRSALDDREERTFSRCVRTWGFISKKLTLNDFKFISVQHIMVENRACFSHKRTDNIAFKILMHHLYEYTFLHRQQIHKFFLNPPQHQWEEQLSTPTMQCGISWTLNVLGKISEVEKMEFWLLTTKRSSNALGRCSFTH